MDHQGRIIDGRYRLLAPAGRGGMAQVWRAEGVAENETRRSVAIKRILPGLRDADGASAMFADEARIAAALDHPNIVRFEHFGRDSQGPYMAMEWVEGVTLDELMEAHGGALPQAVVVAIGRDVLHALAAAHNLQIAQANGRRCRSPVIHRDVSPANILVTVAGVAKLADFGLARSLRAARTQPRGTAPGKVGYLPPEVLGRHPHGVRGDLYAVGVVLWEALVGRRLFAGLEQGPALYRALLHKTRTRVSEARPSVAPAIGAVIDRALALDPAARFASAQAMADALMAAAGDLGGAAPGVAISTMAQTAVAAVKARREAAAHHDDAPEVLLEAYDDEAVFHDQDAFLLSDDDILLDVRDTQSPEIVSMIRAIAARDDERCA